MLTRAQAELTSVLGAGWTLPSARQYLVALVLLTAALFVLWLLSLRWDRLSYLLVVFQATMAINVLTHVAGVVALRGYAPGVVTAVLAEAVASVVVYRRMKQAGWMSRRQWVLLPILALVIHGPVAFGLAALILR